MRSSCRLKTLIIPAAAMLALLPSSAWASAGPAGDAHEIGRVLLGLVIVLTAAKLGGHVMVRIGQPEVLGELVFGIIIGNLYLLNCGWCEFIKTDATVRILSEIGVILLLFQVGLESDLDKMVKVGGSALLVATLGVIAPFILGWGAATWLLPGHCVYVHIFIGATLCATSVGITARVLMDMGWIQTPEARIILGAAVIDDVQGLVVLAIVSGIVRSVNAHIELSSMSILIIVVKATAFLSGAVVLGRWVAPYLFKVVSRMSSANLLLTTALGVCFVFAYTASVIGLAPIVGAFAAGLVLDEVHWRRLRERGEHSVEDSVRPLVAFLAPVFFVVMGARVTLSSFAEANTIGLAVLLTLAAILGKQACSLGVLQRGLDRLSVGIGMIPRGEVGLIFAAIGTQLQIDGHPLIENEVLSAVVFVVLVTTLLTPPGLKWSIGRFQRARQPSGQ